jgi:regulator of PEP synthase PpsR (kinase-PPPase family)
MGAHEVPTLYFVSDGRGSTCAQLVRAALLQFEGREFHTVMRSAVRSARRAQEVVAEAAKGGPAVVFHTLVLDGVRQALQQAAEDALVPEVDLFAHTLPALNTLFRSSPSETPGLLYESEREHFDRIEAIDYTLKHDDGQRPDELHMADVVLVGVSRASKSTTCFYLAYKGVKAANVPLFPDIDPPRELLALDPQKVIALKINLMRLRVVREARAVTYGMKDMDSYTARRELARELRYANNMAERYDWRSVDVSYKAVEEIGSEVLRLQRGSSR